MYIQVMCFLGRDAKLEAVPLVDILDEATLIRYDLGWDRARVSIGELGCVPTVVRDGTDTAALRLKHVDELDFVIGTGQLETNTDNGNALVGVGRRLDGRHVVLEKGKKRVSMDGKLLGREEDIPQHKYKQRAWFEQYSRKVGRWKVLSSNFVANEDASFSTRRDLCGQKKIARRTSKRGGRKARNQQKKQESRLLDSVKMLRENDLVREIIGRGGKQERNPEAKGRTKAKGTVVGRMGVRLILKTYLRKV